MIVRLKFGRDNGELRDIAPDAALAMLQDGRAENPFAELTAVDARFVEERSIPQEEVLQVFAVDPQDVTNVDSTAKPKRKSRR